MFLTDLLKRALGRSTDDAIRRAGPLTPVDSIEAVIARMRSIADHLPERDGVARFNQMYLEVTLLVRDASRGHDFEDPRFLELLDVVFANLYFDALARYETDAASCPRAWAPLFDSRASRRIAPIQFALAGMNAHINRDLVSAVVETCRRLDLEPRRGTPAHRDFSHINQLLAQAQEKVEPKLKTGILGLVDRLLGRSDEAAENWSITRAREAAWTQAETLWQLRADAALSERWLLVLDRTVGFAGRGLLVERLF